MAFEWNSPDFAVKAEFAKPTVARKYRTLKDFADEAGQEKHGVLVDYDVFERASAPDRSDPQRIYRPAQFDFRLRAGSAAVDAGVAIPNITDGFTGKAPDLGAYELGQPLPHYGPRNGDKSSQN